MIVEIEEFIKLNLEASHDFAITEVKTIDGMVYQVTGFNKDGFFTMNMVIVLAQLKVNT